MGLLNQEVQEQLKEHFQVLKKEVRMNLVVDDCDSCDDTKMLLEEVTLLSDKLNLEVIHLNSEKAKAFNINRTPVIMFEDEEGKDLRIRFNGIPAGHEFSAFITTLTEVGGAGEVLPPNFIEKVNAIDKDITIQVFVTLGCPHCSGAVAKAHKLALMNKNIKAEMIECGTFPELADKYNVSGVPKIVINETEELVGNQPMDMFLDTINKLN